MRSFERSATNSRPLESMARAWGHVEFALPLARFAPGLDEFSVLRELHDARVGLLAMSVGDEDVAFGRDQDIGRPIEGVGPIARDSGLAQRHQHLSVGTKLDDRVALAVAASAVGDPDVAIPVREQAVWPIDHAAAEARHPLAGGVELVDRRESRALAGLCAAAIVDPDAGAISIDVDSDRLPPHPAFGEFRPILYYAIGVGDWKIWKGKGKPRASFRTFRSVYDGVESEN